jgi:hypothetical protein
MEEAFDEGQGPHRAVEPVMMMMMMTLNVNQQKPYIFRRIYTSCLYPFLKSKVTLLDCVHIL